MTTTNAYNEGWNANIADKSVFSNPYFGTDMHGEWLKGYRDCQKEWEVMPSYQKQPTRK